MSQEVTAYFWSAQDAREAAEALKTLMRVSGPLLVSPAFQGRAWALEITPPASLSPMEMFPNAEMLSLINRQVMAHDGLAETPQRKPVMTEANRLATPLPDSVLDRYYAQHPDEADFRKQGSKGAENPLEDFFGEQ